MVLATLQLFIGKPCIFAPEYQRNLPAPLNLLHAG